MSRSKQPVIKLIGFPNILKEIPSKLVGQLNTFQIRLETLILHGKRLGL